MDKVVAGTKLEWSIQNGSIQVLEKGGVTTRETVVLNAKSGMVGSPEHYRKANAETGKKGTSGGSGALDQRVAQTNPKGTNDTGKGSSIISVPPIPPKLFIVPFNIASSTATAGDTYGVAQTNPKVPGGKAAAAKVDGKQKDGWKVTTLLIPTILPGDRVKVEGKDPAARGIFKVDEVTHAGDSHTGDWQTELKLVDPKKQSTDQKPASKGGPAKRGGTTGGVIPIPPIPGTPPPITPPPPTLILVRRRVNV
jgi:hypothetical protein